MGLLNCQGYPQRLSIQEDGHGKLKSPAIAKAEALQSKLGPERPSFIKPLLKSHVTGGFWLGLPASFCQKHLPEEDTFMTLESQSGKLYKAKYLPRKLGLSGGWKGFAISEKLLIGDVLVFHQVSATKFKVFMIRGNKSNYGALDLLNLDTHLEKSDSDMSVDTVEHKRSMHHSLPEADLRTMHSPENSGNSVTGVSSVNSGDFQTREQVVLSCNGIKSFENFSGFIDELLNGYDLPRHVKWSYYKLCCSQKAFLHAQLLEGMNHILIAGTIIETVSIADALRSCNLSTSPDDFKIWENTLHSLGLLGMNVNFLLARMERLQRIIHDPEVAKLRQEHSLLSSENAHAADKIRSLQTTLADMMKIYKEQAVVIENLKSKIESHELKFQEHARAPW